MTYEKRGLYIDDAHLESFAENQARAIRPLGETGGKAAAQLLQRQLKLLDNLHDALALEWEGVPAMPGAVRWLLDNHYLAQREGRLALQDLRSASHLRFGRDGTVLMILAGAYIRSGRYEVSEERLTCFLQGAQHSLILQRGELSLFIRAVQAALIGALVQLYTDVRAGDESPETETEAGRIFTSLRYLSTADLSEVLEKADYVEQTLLADPSGVYGSMSRESRAYYRDKLSELARQHRLPEYKVAQKVIELAAGSQGVERHVGYWLLEKPLGQAPTQRNGGAYIASNMLGTLFFSLLFSFWAKSAASFFLLLLPISELVKSILDFVLLHTVKPVMLPRLSLCGGIPPEGKTLCCVSALLTELNSGAELAGRLEEYRLCNRDAGQNALYAILADLPDTNSEAFPDGPAFIAAAAAEIDALNIKYGGGFYLLTRKRTKTPDGRFMGWERKRGALLETMRYLRGEKSGIRVSAGDVKALEGTKFLLALDSDTRLLPGAFLQMVGTMLHPLCKPIIDSKKGIVRRGHGMLSPRIGTDLSSAGKTDFSRVFAPQGGTDPYGGLCSSLYMDFWRSGGFAGKGIIDIDAYLYCMGSRVPEHRMLSHDAVEGAFLRSGFLSDVELTDAFPAKVLSYLKRAARWVRGDWQNLPWLFRRGRALPSIERWRLFDSLRRSLVPVMTLAALCVGFFVPRGGLVLAAVAAIAALCSELLLTTAQTFLQKESDARLRFQSKLFVGIGGGIVRSFLRLILLPAEAWFHFSALCKALWRMCVSKRKMLEWQTAEQGDHVRSGLVRHYLDLWFAAVLGVMLLGFSGSIIGKAMGAIWLLSPLCALLLSLSAQSAKPLRESERSYLRACTAETWRYFERFLTAEDHYLPPDNFQAQPPVGLAHRTSPTNIGLALLSVLAAMDLEFVEKQRGLELIGHTLETTAQLEKWHGHLLNWYDTQTLRPLNPRYVSTVDSGNLCACLIALSGGLREYGADALAEQAMALSNAMDFSPLFDETRKLFYIGWDFEKEGAGESWYDLLSSEARLTAYLAVARGDVPRSGWKKLSRALLQSGFYRGMASWTGSMFEYLMPELLLPLQRDSLLWETAKFCLFVQKRKTGNKLWGCSESAYAALDPGMNYRYKAHGCAAAALKRGMDDELVLSPYSSFLALAVQPKSAIENLRRFETLGMRGSLGFWEALDLTKGRGNAAQGSKIRCVMAHHAGMSVVAAANALLDGIMPRRFFADPAMRSHLPLLQEKIPLGGATIKRQETREHTRPMREEYVLWERSGQGTDFRRPACCLLASQTYNLLCTESGITRASWGAIAPYVSPRSPLSPEKGIDFILDTGTEAFSLLPDVYGAPQAEFGWQFSTSTVCISAKRGDLTAHCCANVAAEHVGEWRDVSLSNSGQAEYSADLLLRFRPLLASNNDYVNHPAFFGLGISARVKEGCLLLRRLSRGRQRELWMCLAPSSPCSYDLAPGRVSGRADRSIPATSEEYFLTDPLVTASCHISLAPNETARIRFALALAYCEADALCAATEILADKRSADLPQTAATVLGMTTQDIENAFNMLPDLVFPTAPRSGTRQSELWQFGISGDLPIVAAEYADNAQMPHAQKLMDAHLFLCGCGADFDLVFLSSDGGSYQRPLQSALSNALWRSGGEVLRAARGGVHILEKSHGSALIQKAAARSVDLSGDAPAPLRNTAYRAALPSRPKCPATQGKVRYEWNADNTFCFYVNRSLPQRAWQNILTNGEFSYLATDCGIGNLWHINARENQLLPWLCQPNDTSGPERLFLEFGGKTISFFAAPTDTACRIQFAPGVACWEKKCGTLRLRCTAFVPMDCDCRVMLLECEGAGEAAALHWQMELCLSGNLTNSREVRTTFQSGFLAACSPRSISEAKPFLLTTAPQFETFTCEKSAAMALDYNCISGMNAESVFAVKLPVRERMLLICGCDTPEKMRMYADWAYAAAALEQTKLHWKKTLDILRIKTPDPSLNRLMNGWCAYQALACRMMARSSVYQSGGAFGFRDQLQDAVNLLMMNPDLTRSQILHCCERQYLEGDVQHWWHEGDRELRGVRTRCSDDLLWLPWAVCEYVEKTGDESILSERCHYLTSPLLREEEKDRYEAPAKSDIAETVLQHCSRAINLVVERGVGEHGLLRIGSGDWNDGFDAVGGESQWLSWFFLMVMEKYNMYQNSAAALNDFCEALRTAADRAWDGKWYRRAYYEDGKALGSNENAECRIDSIAQSFAVLSGCADGEKAEIALRSAVEQLFDHENGLIKLFAPPFAGEEHPGYIVSYGPGFRENGGQYTHGALWLIMALLRSGQADTAWDLLCAILPAKQDCSIYKGEPYVLAADVYSAAYHEGEAGWTWYTGSAGWAWRIVTEELLGIRLKKGRLFVNPKLPAAWHGYSAVYRGHRIEVHDHKITVDGKDVTKNGLQI